jgi:hypothetical protein
MFYCKGFLLLLASCFLGRRERRQRLAFSSSTRGLGGARRLVPVRGVQPALVHVPAMFPGQIILMVASRLARLVAEDAAARGTRW